MISIGIAPGLSSLGYCVLHVTPPDFTGYTEDCDILLGSKHSTADLFKRAHVHRLILDVVFERWPPTVLVLGPQLLKKEPPEHVEAARLMLGLAAKAFGIPTISVDSKQLSAVLRKRGRTLVEIVEHRLATPLESRDRRIVLAAATALAGAVIHSGTTFQ